MIWLKKFLVKIWLPKTAKRIVLTLGEQYAMGKYAYHKDELFIRYKKELTNYNAEIIDPEIIEISVSKNFRVSTHMVYQCIDHKCKLLDYSDSWTRKLIDIDKELPQ